jgi:hypothetical protein
MRIIRLADALMGFDGRLIQAARQAPFAHRRGPLGAVGDHTGLRVAFRPWWLDAQASPPMAGGEPEETGEPDDVDGLSGSFLAEQTPQGTRAKVALRARPEIGVRTAGSQGPETSPGNPDPYGVISPTSGHPGANQVRIQAEGSHE